MKYAADFRSIARNALSGRWSVAVIAGLLAGILGAFAINSPVAEPYRSDSWADLALGVSDHTIYATDGGIHSDIASWIVSGATIIMLATTVMAVLYFVLGSIIEVGYLRFNLDLVDRQKAPEIGTLFTYFLNWKTAVAAKLLQLVYVFLWSLLFIIPGIAAAYSYAMTGYILAEHPELTASEAIEKSKAMMYGNRFRLFCLQLSFIGWSLLCVLTMGIGELWLRPYEQAAIAAFYREVSGTEFMISPGLSD